MRKTTKRLAGTQSQEKGLSLPPLNAAEFSARLEDLLSKVSVQNRYAQRISQCNIKNMEELERARHELQRVAEDRKLKELRAGSDQDLLEQLARKANSSEEELKNVFKELVDAKREIKNLRKEIGNLQRNNLELERQVLTLKRERYSEASAAKEEAENSLLATEVKDYLAASERVSSPLYQHCLAAFKANHYSNFLLALERKLEGPTEPKKLSYEHNEGLSRLKLRFSGAKRERSRFKTEHVAPQKYQL